MGAGAGGIFLLGPNFQVSLFNARMNVLKSGLSDRSWAYKVQEKVLMTENI